MRALQARVAKTSAWLAVAISGLTPSAVPDGRARSVANSLRHLETAPGTIAHELWVRLAEPAAVTRISEKIKGLIVGVPATAV